MSISTDNIQRTLHALMKNLGYEGISRITDGAILNIIQEIDSSPDLTKIIQLIIDIYGETYFLLEPKRRKIVFEYLTESQANELCDYLAIKSSSNVWDSLKRMKLSKERKLKLLEYFNVTADDIILDDTFNDEVPPISVLTPEYNLFTHQELAAQRIKKFIQKPRERVLLHMPTGSGKTRTAMSISCDFIRNQIANRSHQNIIWFADTDELCNQAADEFEKAWNHLGVGETTLYRFFGDNKISLSDINGGFVVAGLQKLNKAIDKMQQEFYKIGKETGLLIFDEAHKSVAETYQHIIKVFQTTGQAALLGLSATPGRSTFNDEENRQFADFYHYNKVTLEVEGYSNPVEYLQEEQYLAKTNYHSIPYSPKDIIISEQDLNLLSQGNEIPSNILNQLGIDTKRNISIFTLANQLCEGSKKIILFACSMANAEALYALLKYQNIRAGLVTSETDSIIRKTVIEEYKTGNIQILVNYGVLTTGFDAPKTNAAIIARPTNSLTLFSQMVGRATRGKRAGGNVESDIYVINDALPGFRNMAEAFNHWDDAWIEED